MAELNPAQAALLDAFLDGPAAPDRAAALSRESEGDLMALVAALTDRGARAHLEALGESSVAKPARKAAKKAAYKLKSAGVAGEAQRQAAVDLKLEVDLTDVAVIAAPGWRGDPYMAAAVLGDADGFELKRDPHSGRASVQPLGRLSPARLRRHFRQAAADAPTVDAGVAARIAEGIVDALVAEGADPHEFGVVRAWTAVARAHGADVAGADARASLAAALAGVDEALTGATEPALSHAAGVGVEPPRAVADRLMRRLDSVVHSDEPVEETVFREGVQADIRGAFSEWLGAPDAREAAARWLDITADRLLASGGEGRDAALQVLWTADRLREADGAPLDLPLVARAMATYIDVDAVWEHFQAHLRGEDHHHGHGHGHDHAHDHDHDHDHGGHTHVGPPASWAGPDAAGDGEER